MEAELEFNTNFKTHLKNFIQKFSDDEIFMRSAALAFYSSFSIAPLILLLTSFLGLINIDAQNNLISEVSLLIGPYAKETLENIIKEAQERPDLATISGWTAIFLLLFSASIVFNNLKKTLDIIFKSQQEQEGSTKSFFDIITSKVKERFVSIGLVFSLIFISIFTLILSSAISYFSGRSNIWWQEAINSSFSVIIFTLIFASIYRVIPSRDLSWRMSFKSGVLTSIFFVFGKTAIGIYIGQKSFGSAYGPGGSLVALLVWLYYSSIIVFASAEITSIISNKKERGK